MSEPGALVKATKKVFSRRALMIGAGAGALCAVGGLAVSNASGCSDARVRAPDDLIWGVNGHPITAYPGVSLDEQLDMVKELGFTHYRINLKGDGSPALLKSTLRAAKRKGVCILPILHPWIDMDKESPENIYATSFKLGRDMAHHFRGKVRIWELANELENYAILQPCEMREDGTQYPCEWGPAGGLEPHEYHGPRWQKVSAVLKGLSEGVAAGAPKAIRAMGTAGWGHLGAFERMAKDKIAWDITVWHDYQQVSEDYLKKLAAYGKPIWITEFNAGSGGYKTLEENAAMLKERIAYYREVREKYDVAAAFVYELLDETYWGDTFEARQGLVAIESIGHGKWRMGAIKPPGEAVRQVLRAAK